MEAISVSPAEKPANGLAGLYKPAGLLSLPNTPAEQGRSLLNANYRADEECYEWPGGKLWLLNRLDSATSGVILVADNAALAAVIRDPAHANGFAVMVADGNGDLVSARLQSVDLGDTSGNMIVVKGGLTSGERVITTGVTLVRNGDKVRVIP